MCAISKKSVTCIVSKNVCDFKNVIFGTDSLIIARGRGYTPFWIRPCCLGYFCDQSFQRSNLFSQQVLNIRSGASRIKFNCVTKMCTISKKCHVKIVYCFKNVCDFKNVIFGTDSTPYTDFMTTGCNCNKQYFLEQILVFVYTRGRNSKKIHAIQGISVSSPPTSVHYRLKKKKNSSGRSPNKAARYFLQGVLQCKSRPLWHAGSMYIVDKLISIYVYSGIICERRTITRTVNLTHSMSSR